MSITRSNFKWYQRSKWVRIGGHAKMKPSWILIYQLYSIINKFCFWEQFMLEDSKDIQRVVFRILLGNYFIFWQLFLMFLSVVCKNHKDGLDDDLSVNKIIQKMSELCVDVCMTVRMGLKHIFYQNTISFTYLKLCLWEHLMS